MGTLPLTASYSAAQFETDALQVIAAAPTDGMLLLSGGAMLYIDAVCGHLDDIPTISAAVREQVRSEYEADGLPAMLERLRALDPAYAAQVDPQNTRRILHAIEICRQSGGTFTRLRLGGQRQRDFRIVKIGLFRDRPDLFARINRRTLEMLDAGWLAEAERVASLRHLPALQTIGYRELFAYLDGTLTLDAAVQKIQKGTRVYAKKQMTWWQRQTDITWVRADADAERQAAAFIDAALQRER